MGGINKLLFAVIILFGSRVLYAPQLSGLMWLPTFWTSFLPQCRESSFPCREWQRDVVYLGRPTEPSYMSPNVGWGGGELRGQSQWVQLYTGAQINFGDLTPYLTYMSLPIPADRRGEKDPKIRRQLKHCTSSCIFYLRNLREYMNTEQSLRARVLRSQRENLHVLLLISPCASHLQWSTKHACMYLIL